MADEKRSTSEIVREFMGRDTVARNGLARGLINVRALARCIQVQTHERYTFEALVSALHRYPAKDTSAKRQVWGKLISGLTMKNNIVEVTIKNEPEVPLLLARFSGTVDYGRGDILSIVSNPQCVNVIIDSKNSDRLTRIIPKRNILRVNEGLAAVIVAEAEANIDTPGFAAAIFDEIAMDGINLQEHVGQVGPPSDDMFLVKEPDALRTYQAIERLAKRSQGGLGFS